MSTSRRNDNRRKARGWGIAILLAQTAIASSRPASAAEATVGTLLEGKIEDPAGLLKDSPALVYITGFNEAAPSDIPVIRQNKKRFMPELLPIVKGQTVRFANEDKLKHNVFSSSPARNFDLGLSDPGGEQQELSFEKTGLIQVFCNIHESMTASVLVLPNRAFAMTDAGGRYRISSVPTGKLKIHLYHRLAKPLNQPLEVNATTPLTVDWKLDPSGKAAVHLDKHGRPYEGNRERY